MTGREVGFFLVGILFGLYVMPMVLGRVRGVIQAKPQARGA